MIPVWSSLCIPRLPSCPLHVLLVDFLLMRLDFTLALLAATLQCMQHCVKRLLKRLLEHLDTWIPVCQSRHSRVLIAQCRLFQEVWREGVPVVVRGVRKGYQWNPITMCRATTENNSRFDGEQEIEVRF